MEPASRGGMGIPTSSLRYVASEPDLIDKICIRCYRPGARIVTQKFRALAASESFVVGSSPQICHHPDWSNLQWSLLQWQCAMCQSKWMSYILYDKAYDCRLEDPFYSPTAVLERASMNQSALQLPPYTHNFDNDQATPLAGMLLAQTDTCHLRDMENQVNSANPMAIINEEAAQRCQSSSRVAPSVAFESSPLLSGSTVQCSDESWSAYNAMAALNSADAAADSEVLARPWVSTLGQCDNEEDSSDINARGFGHLYSSRVRATSDTATTSNNGNDHRRGPHFDPEEYKKARGRGACELHKRIKKACRHPEHDHT